MQYQEFFKKKKKSSISTMYQKTQASKLCVQNWISKLTAFNKKQYKLFCSNKT